VQSQESAGMKFSLWSIARSWVTPRTTILSATFSPNPASLSTRSKSFWKRVAQPVSCAA
jgi:hypothetical protein